MAKYFFQQAKAIIILARILISNGKRSSSPTIASQPSSNKFISIEGSMEPFIGVDAQKQAV